MVDTTHIKKLAQLSRISIQDDEVEVLQDDLDAILEYVEQITESTADTAPEAGVLRNVMREDGEPHKSGAYTDAILAQAPNTKNGAIEVKKIIEQE